MKQVINPDRLTAYLEKEKEAEKNWKILKATKAGDIFRNSAYVALNEYRAKRTSKNFARYEKFRNDAVSQYGKAAELILNINEAAKSSIGGFLVSDIDIGDEKQMLYLVDEYVEQLA